jgi:indolepyruvate ferredoxin oxidoreductase alpha subunit
LIIVDNGYSAATGGQDIPSLVEPNQLIATTIDAQVPGREDAQSIAEACRGAGVEWIRTVSTYDIDLMKVTLRDALVTRYQGLKVIIAEGECMLNRQRRIKPLMKQSIADGKRTLRARFVVDSNTCTGDHACIRISGCPSLTIKPNPDPLRPDPVSYVDNSCVGCGVCGSNAHAAILCPSFARVDLLHNPGWLDRGLSAIRSRVIHWLQTPEEEAL